jgi:hypothetical protein
MKHYFTEDGTYGDASSLSVFNTANWTASDWKAIEESCDSDRLSIAHRIERNTTKKATNTMTDAQKRIATEIIYQREKAQEWKTAYLEAVKRDEQDVGHIRYCKDEFRLYSYAEAVLEQILRDLGTATKESV